MEPDPLPDIHFSDLSGRGLIDHVGLFARNGDETKTDYPQAMALICDPGIRIPDVELSSLPSRDFAQLRDA